MVTNKQNKIVATPSFLKEGSWSVEITQTEYTPSHTDECNKLNDHSFNEVCICEDDKN